MGALLSIPSGVLTHMTAVIEAARLRMERTHTDERVGAGLPISEASNSTGW